MLPLLRRRPRVEQIWFALFLAAMPVVYVEAAFVGGAPVGAELIGVLIFGTLALAGPRYPRVLVAGLLLHGSAGTRGTVSGDVVHGWYAVARAVIDVSLACYAASRVMVWSAPGCARS